MNNSEHPMAFLSARTPGEEHLRALRHELRAAGGTGGASTSSDGPGGRRGRRLGRGEH